MNLGTAPFDAVGAPFFSGNATVFHGEGGIVWTGGISVFIVTDFLQGTFIAGVVRDQSPGEMEIVQQGTIKGSGVKGGITKESVWMEAGMQGKEVGKDRNQRGSVANRFVFIRGIRFLFNSQLRMSLFKAGIIGKGNVADNPKTVGKDGEFIGIAEMAVDVHLFCIRAGGGMGRHKAVSHGVWINFGLVLVKGSEFSDEGIEVFGIVFGNIKLNTGGVKGKDPGQLGIDHLADGLSIVHHLFKHG